MDPTIDIDLSIDANRILQRNGSIHGDSLNRNRRVDSAEFGLRAHITVHRQRALDLQGLSVTNGTESVTVTGSADVALIVTVGGNTILPTCKLPSIAIGIGRLNTLRATQANTARASAIIRLETTIAAGQR